jgi:hypothetical protein
MSQAMTGEGDYDRHSAYQMRGAATHTELVASAAERIDPEPARGSVVFADYGCAQGRVSNALIRVAVEHTRAGHPDVPICVYHNDLLANDWATLFAHLREGTSYLGVAGGPITPLVSATSFYEPVTPRGVVDLGMSFAAVQWLAAPGPPGSGSALYFDQLEGRARAAMAAQAHADWTRFLERRADELAPGGRLVVDMMGVSEDGAAGHDAWCHVRSIAEELVDEGALDADRLDAYVIPIYERTVEEVRRPFDEAIGQRLALEGLSIADTQNPASDRFRKEGDAAAFARDFVGFFRAFSEPSLREAIDPRGGTVDELYRRLEARLTAGADEFSFVIHLVTAVIALR